MLTEELLLKMNRNNLVMLDFFRAHDLLNKDYDEVIEQVKFLDHELATWLIRNKDQEEYFLAYTPREEMTIDQGYKIFDHKIGDYRNFNTEAEIEAEIERIIYGLVSENWIHVHKILSNTMGYEQWVAIGKNIITGSTATQITVNNVVDQELLIDIRARIVTVPKNSG